MGDHGDDSSPDPHEPLLSLDDLTSDVFDRWQGVDTETLGRVLRAHLIVEHLVTEAIESRNPNLQNVWTVRIDFSEKLKLIEIPKWLRTAIRQLSEIRNRFVHRLDYRLSEGDVAKFREHMMLKGALERTKLTNGVEASPLEVFELACSLSATMVWIGTKTAEKLNVLKSEHEMLKTRSELLAEMTKDEEGDPSP